MFFLSVFKQSTGIVWFFLFVDMVHWYLHWFNQTTIIHDGNNNCWFSLLCHLVHTRNSKIYLLNKQNIRNLISPTNVSFLEKWSIVFYLWSKRSPWWQIDPFFAIIHKMTQIHWFTGEQNAESQINVPFYVNALCTNILRYGSFSC